MLWHTVCFLYILHQFVYTVVIFIGMEQTDETGYLMSNVS